MQKLLNCAAMPAAVAKAVSSWDALELTAAIDEHKRCGHMVRTEAGTGYVRASLCQSGLIIYRQGDVGYQIGGCIRVRPNSSRGSPEVMLRRKRIWISQVLQWVALGRSGCSLAFYPAARVQSKSRGAEA